MVGSRTSKSGNERTAQEGGHAIINVGKEVKEVGCRTRVMDTPIHGKV